MPSNSSKIVLVTGASSGIGAAVAREAARRGHALALTARRGERLDALAAALRRDGTAVATIPADLADPDAPEQVVAATVARFGGLDVLINNAGVGLSRMFSRSEPEAIRRQLEVNLVAPILLARHALPHLSSRRGTIINVGSAITSLASPALGTYGTTKAGLAYWTHALRRELRHRGVRVCLVEPGPIATEFFEALELAPARRIIEYNMLLQPPPRWTLASADVIARRIVRLIDRPRRRISVRRRMVWPFRVIGGVLETLPWLGDLLLSNMVRHFDRPDTLAQNPSSPARSPEDAPSSR